MPVAVDSSNERENTDKAAAISAAIEHMWVRFLPQTRARVQILESAALALERGTLTPDECEAAAGAAHKLAGTLGTFNLARGTVVARELEQLYGSGKLPSPEIAAQLASELREMIEGRSGGQGNRI